MAKTLLNKTITLTVEETDRKYYLMTKCNNKVIQFWNINKPMPLDALIANMCHSTMVTQLESTREKYDVDLFEMTLTIKQK